MSRVEHEFALKVLRFRADVFSKKVIKLVSDITDETVHEARVESRRMRAALEAFREMFPSRPFDSVHRAVRQMTRLLGRPRETAVSLSLIRELTRSGAAEPFCLKYLHKRFASRLKKQEGWLHKRLRRIDPARLLSRLQCLLSEIEPNEHHVSARHAAVSSSAHGRRRTSNRCQPTLFQMRESAVEHSHRVVTGLTAPISEFQTQRFDNATDEEFHSLRIAAKRSRYAMEIFSSIWPGGLSNCIEKARRFQNAGGAYNDWSALCSRFEREIERLDSAASVHLAFQIGRLAAAAESRKASAKVSMRAALVEFQKSLAGLAYANRLKAASNLRTMIVAPSSRNTKRRSPQRKRSPANQRG